MSNTQGGRRSISRATEKPRHAPLRPDAFSRQAHRAFFANSSLGLRHAPLGASRRWFAALEIEPRGATRPNGRCYICCNVPWPDGEGSPALFARLDKYWLTALYMLSRIVSTPSIIPLLRPQSQNAIITKKPHEMELFVRAALILIPEIPFFWVANGPALSKATLPHSHSLETEANTAAYCCSPCLSTFPASNGDTYLPPIKKPCHSGTATVALPTLTYI